MSTDLLQFYPTPPTLVTKMWACFKSDDYRLVLDPSAGNGDLIGAKTRSIRKERLHCIEIDPTRQATLRGLEYKVIDTDFLRHEGGFFYSHIIMNPPFNRGADHVLRALSMLYNGELVALVSASTVRHPRGDAERELVAMIEMHSGTIEYMTGAFQTSETERVTGVDIAIIHIRVSNKLDNPYIKSLKKDEEPEIKIPDRYEIAFPQSRVDDLLNAFTAAVAALREFTLAEDAYIYHRSFLSTSQPPHRAAARNYVDAKNSVSHTYNTAYAELRSCAWDKVLQSTEFQRHLSHKAMQRLRGDFDNIRVLAFTKENVLDFLGSLIRDRKKMQLGMMMDSFDLVTRHATNKAFFISWKSNDKHRECAYRMKTTRFILPVHESFFDYPSHGSLQEIHDLERVFAMLEGHSDIPEDMLTASTILAPLHHNAPNGAVDHLRELSSGKRLKTEYFDVRYYSGKGTCHLFPTRPDLVERLNREVGRNRNWLPDTEPDDSPYWQQYAAAEKVTAELVKRERDKAQCSYTRKEEAILWSLQNSPTQLDQALSEIHADLNLVAALDHQKQRSLSVS